MFSGACSSATTTITAGSTSLPLAGDTGGSALADGVYSNCTITVTDTVGNQSAPLAISSFTVDRTPPTLALTTAPSALGADSTPSLSFTSTEIGTISYGGNCESATTIATTGSNTISLAGSGLGYGLPDGTYTNCTIQVQDTAGNSSSVLAIPSFSIDTVAPQPPVLSGIFNPTRDNTPTLSYTVAEAGLSVQFSSSINGSVGNGTSVSGSNSITLTQLSDGVHVIQVALTDSASNSRSTSFSLTVDTTPPSITLVGDDPVTVPFGGTYTDAGASANDALAGDLTAEITTIQQVNTASPGSYTVTYLVADRAGNATTRSRTVTVSSPTPTPTPTATIDPTSRRVAVTVLDEEQAPIENASVNIVGLVSQLTNASGEVLVTPEADLFDGARDFSVSIRKDGYVFPASMVSRGGSAVVAASEQVMLPDQCSATDGDLERVLLSSKLSELFSHAVQLLKLAETRARATKQRSRSAAFNRNERTARLAFAEIQAALLNIPSRTVTCDEGSGCQTVSLLADVAALRNRSGQLRSLSTVAAVFLRKQPAPFAKRAARLLSRAQQAQRSTAASLGNVASSVTVCP